MSSLVYSLLLYKMLLVCMYIIYVYGGQNVWSSNSFLRAHFDQDELIFFPGHPIFITRAVHGVGLIPPASNQTISKSIRLQNATSKIVIGQNVFFQRTPPGGKNYQRKIYVFGRVLLLQRICQNTKSEGSTISRSIVIGQNRFFQKRPLVATIINRKMSFSIGTLS